MADLLDGQAWVAFEYDGRPWRAEHGGPARLLVPHLYLWKSAKWVRRIDLTDQGRARVLGEPGLSQLWGPMARAAVLGRLTWQVGTVAEIREETATARTIVLDVPGWPGHAAGQHVDVRLTAEDGYSTQRSYSIASAPGRGRLELTVQRLEDGEVSPYLTDELRPGYPLELRGPIGGWFVWDPAEPGPVLLVAGGSGMVPLMSMIRARAAAGSQAPFRLVYSVRSPETVLYAGRTGAAQPRRRAGSR